MANDGFMSSQHLRSDLTYAEHFRIQTQVRALHTAAETLAASTREAGMESCAKSLEHFAGQGGALFTELQFELEANPPQLSSLSGKPSSPASAEGALQQEIPFAVDFPDHIPV